MIRHRREKNVCKANTRKTFVFRYLGHLEINSKDLDTHLTPKAYTNGKEKVSSITTHCRTKVEMPEMLLYLPEKLTGNKEPQKSTLLSQ